MTDASTLRSVLSDAELILATRSGDDDAFGALYERHIDSARAAARALTRSKADADDVVADAFARVLGILQRGGGPDVSFRPYLLTTLRNAMNDHGRKARREEPTEAIEDSVNMSLLDAARNDDDKTLIAQAYASLPERWQLVLWHTEVEGSSPAEVAPLLGMTANAVAALAYRAREGLRTAYLQSHLQRPLADDCHDCATNLGAYVRDGLAARDRRRLDQHLATCESCQALLAELQEANTHLRAVLLPLLLGVPAAKYFSGMAAGHGVVAVVKRLPRASQIVLGSTAATVVSVGLLAGIVYVAGSDPSPRTSAEPSTTIVVDGATGGAPGDPVQVTISGTGSRSDQSVDPSGSTDDSTASTDTDASTNGTSDDTSDGTSDGTTGGGGAAGGGAVGTSSTVFDPTETSSGTTRSTVATTTATTSPVIAPLLPRPTTPTTSPPTTPRPTTPITPAPTTPDDSTPSTAAPTSPTVPDAPTTAAPTTATPTTATPTTATATTIAPTTTAPTPPDPRVGGQLVGIAYAGGPARVRVTVANGVAPTGSTRRIGGDAASLTVQMTMPNGIVFRSVDDPAWSCSVSGTILTCTTPGVVAGSHASAVITLGLPAGATAVTLAPTVVADGVGPIAAVGPITFSPVAIPGALYVDQARGSVLVVGNSSMTCDAGTSTCIAARNGTPTTSSDDLNRQHQTMRHVKAQTTADTDGVRPFNSSRAVLDLGTAGVSKAYLMIGGDTIAGGGRAPESTAKNTIRMTDARGGVHVLTSGDVRTYGDGSQYTATFDVTAIVAANGSGSYQVANIQSAEGVLSFAGWQLVVVTADSNAPMRLLAVVGANTTIDGSNAFTVVVPLGSAATRATTVAVTSFEGELGYVGESVTIGGVAAGNASNPVDNPFGSSIAGASNPATVNGFGVDADLFTSTISTADLVVTASSEFDFVRVGLVALAVDIDR